ncbi:MAG TPA: nucleotide sugar dehydrogenase [Solirubrobacteraceae bacterium]|nr:nucleotide sugar dehydrogenase [Solirubrobacteraceae bacterium]
MTPEVMVETQSAQTVVSAAIPAIDAPQTSAAETLTVTGAAPVKRRSAAGRSAPARSAAPRRSGTPAPQRRTRRAKTGHTVVAVVGLGYVGLPTAIALRNAGCRIVGIDVSARRLDAIRAGEAELLREERRDLRSHLADDGFVLTSRIKALDSADLVLICVPTPVDQQLKPDLTILKDACASVVSHARPGQTIVLTSTTYVGTTRELLVAPLAARGLTVGEDVFVAFAPERIDPGVKDHEQLQTPRVVGGVTEDCFKRAAEVLAHTCKFLHRVSSPEAAEMVKLYENTFRAVNIALSFEMAEACRAHELDPIEVTEGAATKPYGFLAHYPSAGVGGHCIGVDPYYLLHALRDRGRPAMMAEQALRKVTGRPRHVAWRAHELLVEMQRALPDARILVVGASYKPGVADTREAPAVEIIARLRAEGAHVDYHDPLVPTLMVGASELHGVGPDAQGYDLTIVATLHPEHDYGWLEHADAVLDCTYRTTYGSRRFHP